MFMLVFKLGLIVGFHVGLDCDVGAAFCFDFEFDVDGGFDVAFRFGVEYTCGLEVDAVDFGFNVGFACEPNLDLVSFRC